MRPRAPLRLGVEFQEKDFDSVGKELSSNLRLPLALDETTRRQIGGSGGVDEWLLARAFCTEESGPAERQCTDACCGSLCSFPSYAGTQAMLWERREPSV